MILYEGTPEKVKTALDEAVKELRRQKKRVGVIDFNGDADEAAHSFFRELRAFDKKDVDIIIVAGVPETGIGFAVMNRMRNAANGNIIKV